MRLEPAEIAEAGALAALHAAVAEDLTAKHGKGRWSSAPSERGVLSDMKTGRVYVARQGEDILATLKLATKKPWAIDTSYFAPAKRPLYLLAMAVRPARQRQGIGRLCIGEAVRLAREWPADALRLDAYDADAGAGEFYRRCGFQEVGRVTYKGNPLLYFERLL